MKLIITVDDDTGHCGIESDGDDSPVMLWGILALAHEAIRQKFFSANEPAPTPEAPPLIVTADSNIKRANYKTPVGL